MPTSGITAIRENPWLKSSCGFAGWREFATLRQSQSVQGPRQAEPDLQVRESRQRSRNPGAYEILNSQLEEETRTDVVFWIPSADRTLVSEPVC